MREFLTSEPAHTGVVGTVRPDGRVHLKPIWFRLVGSELEFNTGEDTVAGKNLARDPRVTICVEDERPPYAYVLIDGVASLGTFAEDAAALKESAAAIGARYLGADKGEALGERNGVPGEYLVRVRINKISGARNVSD
jgi:PPOX class probable F420-dependent enzyme